MEKYAVTCVQAFILFILPALCFLVSPFVASAQTLERLEIPSSFNPVGSGARALGMGGAFIAVADDATAASWNPGGLIQLETPEVSAVGAYVYRTEDLYFGRNPEASGSENITNTNVNYLSAAYPFFLAWPEHDRLRKLSASVRHVSRLESYLKTRRW